MIHHEFYTPEDEKLAGLLPEMTFFQGEVKPADLHFDHRIICQPDERFGFLHETAIIEYKGVLYASWYHCPTKELQGYTPICGKRSFDGGKTWSELEILMEDPSEKIMYCPPVYGICDGRLYMLVNQMVAPDHIHSLDLYILNESTGCFEILWSRPIPFKLNTNVIRLKNGKLLLPGRVGELDRFPNTPAVMISDSGRIDGAWRIVRIAENGDLPDESRLIHPEISLFEAENTLYMFCRNDERHVPLVYTSADCGESWSCAHGHDVPYISSKIYAGNLSNGRNFLVANIDRLNRSRLAIYFTEPGSKNFTRSAILFDSETTDMQGVTACHYPAVCESEGKLHIITTINYEWSCRGAALFTIDL